MPYQPSATDFFQPRIWRRALEQLPIPAQYIGDSIFPEEDVPGDKLQWPIYSSDNGMSPFVALDQESPVMDEEEFTIMFADLAYVREKFNLLEHDVRMLRELGDLPVDGAISSFIQNKQKNIARRMARLRRRVLARKEWMQINCALGSISYVPNAQSGVKFALTFPVVPHTAAPLWSDTAGSDPVKDFQDWTVNLDYNIGRMIIGRSDLLNLARNTKIRNAMFTQANNVPTTVSIQAAKTFFSEELGIQITEYNARYSTRTFNGSTYTTTQSRFLPNGKVILLPEGERVGYFATAPSVYNNFANPGLFTWFDDPENGGGSRDPYVFSAGVGIYGFPVFEWPDRVHVSTVA